MSKIGDFFKGLLDKALSAFHKVEEVEETLFEEATKVTDWVKNAEASEAGQMLETGLEAAFPVLTPFIGAGKLWLVNASAKLANVQGVITTDEGKLEAFINYLKTIQVSDPVLYSGTLATLNASYQQFKINLQDNPPVLTHAMSIVAGQVVNDPNLGMPA